MTCCTVTGCARRQRTRALCDMHYQRLRKSGDVGSPAPRRNRVDRDSPCSVDECPGLVLYKGLCSRHAQRLDRHGATGGAAALVGARGSGHLDKRGYRQITVAGVRWLEHRYVMSEALGRPLREDEEVHHRNGRRADNRLSNLEVWVTSQPAGQRPEDLVAYVVRYYPDLVREALR